MITVTIHHKPSPSVFNSGFAFVQFWDDSIRKLLKAPAYQKAFSLTYSDGITEPNIKHSIATYERSLTGELPESTQ
ncbi:MAG: hypothetical protein RPU64_01200 [Candidatus Sedimenticola sp. (ex Thyasira tokunagai)]